MKKQRMAEISIVLIFTLLVYWQSFSIPFFFNEEMGLINQNNVKSLETYFQNMSTWAALFYRPLSVLSYSINYWISDTSFSFHVVNFIIHLLNVFLVYRISGYLFRFPWLPALMFAAHPMATSVVSLTNGRPYALGFLFFLTSFYLILKWDRDINKKRLTLLALLSSLAILSKQSFVIAPVALFLIWSEFDKKEIALFLKSYMPRILLVFGLLLGIALWHILSHLGNAPTGMFEYFIAQIGNLPNTLLLYLFPSKVVIYHDFAFHELGSREFIQGVTLFALCVYGVSLLKDAKLNMFLALFLVFLLPTNSFIPKNEIIYAWRLYPSTLFFVFMLARFGEIYWERVQSRKLRTLLPAFIAVWICVFSYFTLRQNYIYQSPAMAYSQALKLFPNSIFLNKAMGWQLAKEGRYEESISHFETVLHQIPGETFSARNIIPLYVRVGKTEKANAFAKQLREDIFAK